MITNKPLSLVVFMTGPMKGISGGDIHALKLATYWNEQSKNTTLIAPVFLKYDANLLGRRLKIISPEVPFEKKLQSSLFLYPLLVVLRLVKYSVYSPEAEVAVAASHLFGDVIACLVHRFRYKSQPIIYVHHILALAGRSPTFRSKISIILELISLTLAKRYSALIIVSNPETKMELVKRGFPLSAIYESTNGVERISINFENINLPNLYLTFCGRLTEEKGIWDILTVAEYIKSKFPLVRIYVIGDGPLRSLLEERVDTAKLDNISILGYISEEHKWYLLERACLFLAPSREEGWGIAVDEALTVGTPVVAYNLPAYSRLGKAIIKVNPVGDATAFTKAVAVFLNDTEQQKAAVDSLSSFHKSEWKDIIDLEVKFIRDKLNLRACK